MDALLSNNHGWQLSSNLQVFWKDIASADHLFQIYESESVLLDSLEGFAGTGFMAGENVIIVATASHLEGLEQRLLKQGFDIPTLSATDRYITFDAELLAFSFFVDGRFDEKLLLQAAAEMLERIRKNGRQIRIFGEMVSVLWSKGYHSETRKLEEIWDGICEREKFCLFCAYPKNSFTPSDRSSYEHICTKHSKQVGGWAKPSTDIFYKPTKVKPANDNIPPDSFIDLFF